MKKNTAYRIKEVAGALRFLEIVLAISLIVIILLPSLAGIKLGAAILLFLYTIVATIMLHALYCFLYGFSDILIRMEIISKDVRKISRTVKTDDDTEQREIDPYDEYFDEE